MGIIVEQILTQTLEHLWLFGSQRFTEHLMPFGACNVTRKRNVD